jgi:predicted metal-binding membrane protein
MFVRHPRVELAGWTAMAVAMMLPLARPQARWLAFRSLPRHRHRSVAAFAVAYVGVWTAAGAVAVAALAPVRGRALAVAVALGVAALWHRAPRRRRLLLRCGVRRVPAAAGWRAPADWLRTGAAAGARCVATCGPLMLPMAIAHQPALTVGTALVLASERRPGPNPERRAGRRLEAACLASAALLVATVAIAAAR